MLHATFLELSIAFFICCPYSFWRELLSQTDHPHIQMCVIWVVPGRLYTLILNCNLLKSEHVRRLIQNPEGEGITDKFTVEQHWTLAI